MQRKRGTQFEWHTQSLLESYWDIWRYIVNIIRWIMLIFRAHVLVAAVLIDFFLYF